MLDLFFRAETPATLRTVIRSAPFRNVVGDLRARDEDGNVVSGIRMLPGSVDYVYFAPGSVVITPATYDGNGDIITPAVTDGWCWMQLRLYGDAEAADFEDDPADVEPDRWNKSRIRKWMKANGTFVYLDQDPAWSSIPNAHIRGFMYTLGNGKRIGILRGSEMEAAGPPVYFHKYLGGNWH